MTKIAINGFGRIGRPEFKKNPPKNKGFTIIELLVVIAVIGLLSTIILVSLNSARAKARDAKRKADLRAIQTALEIYYNENGTYILSGYGWNGTGIGYFAYDGRPNTVSKGLVDRSLLSSIVDDPLVAAGSQSGGYMIYTCNSGQTFAISATLENPSAADIAHIQTTCNGTGANGTYSRYGKNYALP